jgi:sialate O-acetylesterase
MNANKIKRMKLVGYSPDCVSMVRSQVPPVCGNPCDSQALLRFSASILFLITAVLLAPAYASPEAPPSTELTLRAWDANVNPAGRVEGRNTWRSARYKDQKAARYFYFGVLRPELKNGNAQSVEVVIHYLDQAAVKLHLEYDPADGAVFKKTETIQTSGSGGWKEAKWQIPDAGFRNRANAHDFRLVVEEDVDFVIGECTVSGSPRFHTILPDVFSEHMVLQRDTPIPVSGLGRDNDKVKVELAGKSYETVVQDGKWKLLLDAQNVSFTPAKLVISASDGFRREINDVLVGDVWFASGQSNMQMKVACVEGGPVALAEPHAEALRLFTVSPFLENSAAPMGSNWAPSSLNSATEMSAVAWFFGREIQKTEGIPVGIINCSFGGTITETWCSPGTLAKGFPEWETFNAQNLNQPNKNEWSRRHTASYLYLHMIQTIAPFPVKGFLWYQGEANAGRAAEQKRLFPAMVDGWRQAWGNPSLPIFFAQLARFQEADWHDFRDAQRWIAANNPNMYLAVTIDLPRDFSPQDYPVHPLSKIPIAHRMALAARANIYGEKNLEWSGPQVKSWSVDGDAAVLEFSHATGGLMALGGGPLRGFFLSGDGKKFTEAVATIQGSALRLRAEGVQKPIAVRYGSEADQGKEKLEVNLANQEGLPASPFTLL